MPRPDEGLIHAWLDGELSPDEAARVERLVAADAEWGAAAAEARGFVAASSRILRALDHVPGDVIPAGGNRAPARRPFASRTWVRIAAGVVLVAGVSVAVNTDATRVGDTSVPLVDTPSPQVASDSIDAATASESRRVVVPPAATPSIASGAVPTVSTSRDARIEAPRERATALADRTLQPPSPAPAPPSPQRSVGEPAPSASAELAVTNAPAVAGAAVGAAAERERLESQRAAAARLEQSAAASLRQRREASAPVAQGFGAAAKALSVQALDGCWRVTTTAGADSLLVTPRVLRTEGDTLIIDAGVTARPAHVVRVGEDALRGEMPDANDRRVPFTAARVACPVPPTPAPRR